MDAFSAHAPAVHRDQAAGPSNLWAKCMGLADDLAPVPGLTSSHLEALAAHNIRSLDDLADLASDELLEIVGARNLTPRQADAVIVAARAHWFQD
jgi:N utilization substance protein A